MIDFIKIVIDNVNISSDDYIRFSIARKNPDVFVFKKYVEFRKERYKTIIDDYENDTNEQYYKKHRLEFVLLQNRALGVSRLMIMGSIRKWYFGVNSRQDLSLKKYKKCIRALARIAGVKAEEVWNGRTTQLEIGLTPLLKPKDRSIFYCIYDYKNLPKNIFDKNGVEFTSSNYDVIFYDMLRRMYNRKDKKEELYKKIAKNNFLLRYEIQAHKVSGVGVFKDKFNSPAKIRDNWGLIGKTLEKTLQKVKFVDVITPTMYHNLFGAKIKAMNNFAIYSGIKQNGFENMRQFTRLLNNKVRKTCSDKYAMIYNDFLDIEKKENCKQILTDAVAKRIAKLS